MPRTTIKLRRIPARFLQVLALLLITTGAWAQGSASGKPFDHHNTGFPLEGAHAFVPCQSCHTDGEFKGTPRDCVGCHSPNARFNATFKPVTHITSTDQCATCHRPTFWEDVVRVDHMQVMGPCLQCHNNYHGPAGGQPANHIPSPPDCAQCHSDMSWVPANFTHENLVTTCIGCHNNVQVAGMPANHINISTSDCSVCHQSTLSWSPVASVNHDFVLGTCRSCHNNVVARGQHPGHFPTGDTECSVCHNTDYWAAPRTSFGIGEF